MAQVYNKEAMGRVNRKFPFGKYNDGRIFRIANIKFSW